MSRIFHSVSDYEEPMDDNNDSINLDQLDLSQRQHQNQHDQQHQSQRMSLTQQQQQQQQQQLDQTLLNRSEMNELIMDYLVHEGFKEAAERFREEAGIQPKISTGTMDNRIEIRQMIEEGDILKGQSLINLYFPELLDSHRDLYFRLQQQHLLELIRHQKITEALTYMNDQLQVDELKDLTEIERTLTLLAYENPDKSPYSGLLKISHRLQLASEINDVIIQETSGSMEPTKPRLVTLLKFLFWTQSELEKKKIKFPKMNDLLRINGDSTSRFNCPQ